MIIESQRIEEDSKDIFIASDAYRLANRP